MTSLLIAVSALLAFHGLLETISATRVQRTVIYIFLYTCAVLATTALSQSAPVFDEYAAKLLLFALCCVFFMICPQRAILVAGALAILDLVSTILATGISTKYFTAPAFEVVMVLILWNLAKGGTLSWRFVLGLAAVVAGIGLALGSRDSLLIAALLVIYLGPFELRTPVRLAFLVPIFYIAGMMAVGALLLAGSRLVPVSVSNVERTLYLYYLFFNSAHCYLSGCDVDAVYRAVQPFIQGLGVNRDVANDPHSFIASIFMYSGMLPIIIMTGFLWVFGRRMARLEAGDARQMYARGLILIYFADSLTVPPDAHMRLMIAFAVGQMIMTLSLVRERTEEVQTAGAPASAAVIT